MKKRVMIGCIAALMTGCFGSVQTVDARSIEGTWHAFGPYSQYMICIPDEWESLECTQQAAQETDGKVYAEFEMDMNWVRIIDFYTTQEEYSEISVEKLMRQLKKNNNTNYKRYEFDQNKAMYLDYNTETETYEGTTCGISATWLLDLGEDTVLIDMNYLADDKSDLTRMRRLFLDMIDSISLSDRDLLPPIIFTDKETVKLVQTALNEAGFDCGKVDGAAGKKTWAAMEAYQAEHDLEITTEITDDLLDSLGIPVEFGKVPEVE